MQSQFHHWFIASTAAVSVHAALLVGIDPLSEGDQLQPAGTIITLAPSQPDAPRTPTENQQRDTDDRTQRRQAPHGQATERRADETRATQTGEPENTTAPEPGKQPAGDSEPVRTGHKAGEVQSEKPRSKSGMTEKPFNRAVSSRRRHSQNNRAGGAHDGNRVAASPGEVKGYAARVRARILSRPPRAGSLRGTAVISFQLSASGGLRWARISRSSGNGMLDRKALGSVRRAAPFPRPPAGARSRQLRFSIPFRFR